MASVKSVFVRGSVVRYIVLPGDVDTDDIRHGERLARSAAKCRKARTPHRRVVDAARRPDPQHPVALDQGQHLHPVERLRQPLSSSFI